MAGSTYLLLIANGLLLGLCTGFVMHRSDFCIAGMFRDLFIFRQATMLRFLFLLVSLSALLFEAARLFGLFRTYPFPLFGPASLATVIGGILFGIGMVLAGGCAVGTLYKMGSGNFLSLIAGIGLIAGSTAYAEIHPLWSRFRDATTFSQAVTVPQMLGVGPFPVVLACLAVCASLCLGWHRAGKLLRASAAAGYLQPYRAAMVLALVGLCASIVTGMPLGITTTYAKTGAWLEAAFLPGHFQGVQFFNGQHQDYVNPVTHMRLAWSSGPRFDAATLIQLPLIFGIVGGGALSALLLREFRIYCRVPRRQYFSASIGGFVMGMGCRMGSGCNVWHILGGVPILAWQSLFFLAGLMAGAWLGSCLLARFVLK